MMALHRARLSAKVNPFDLMNPNIYVGMKFYLPLREDALYEEVFTRLQEGLRRTMQMIPELEGRVMRCSEHEEGYKKGDLRITLPRCRRRLPRAVALRIQSQDQGSCAIKTSPMSCRRLMSSEPAGSRCRHSTTMLSSSAPGSRRFLPTSWSRRLILLRADASLP